MKPFSEVWRHRKTGGLYIVLHEGLREHDLVPVVVYKSLKDGIIWVRPSDEFDDGRFEHLLQDAAQSPAD